MRLCGERESERARRKQKMNNLLNFIQTTYKTYMSMLVRCLNAGFASELCYCRRQNTDCVVFMGAVWVCEVFVGYIIYRVVHTTQGLLLVCL